jgi:hypothetical protein
MTNEALHGTDVDRLGQALITLTKELWIVKDRQRVLENILADAGLLKSTAIEKYQPGPALETELKTQRQKLVDDVINALTTKP